MVCQYYKYFFEPDDRKLKKIFDAERDGSMLAGEHKAELAATINEYLRKHRQKKERYREKLDSFIVKS